MSPGSTFFADKGLVQCKVTIHNELFQARQPVLVGIDLDSTYCYLLALEAHRDAETWTIHLWELADQGLPPDYVVANGGQRVTRRASADLARGGV